MNSLDFGKRWHTFLIITELFVIRVEGGKEEAGRGRTSPLNIWISPALLSALPSGRHRPHSLLRWHCLSHDLHGMSILPHRALIVCFSSNMADKWSQLVQLVLNQRFTPAQEPKLAVLKFLTSSMARPQRDTFLRDFQGDCLFKRPFLPWMVDSVQLGGAWPGF